ncbi:MAG: cytochrome c [Burkholderiaceae bacterium]|nr:cytochrome c [Burkholderiaceae bacterium]
MKLGRDLASFALAALCAASWAPLDARGADVFRGGELYRRHCAQCHGDDGRPVMPTAPDFTRRERLLQPDPVLLQTVRAGKGAMPGYQGLLRDRDLLDVIAFLRTLQ